MKFKLALAVMLSVFLLCYSSELASEYCVDVPQEVIEISEELGEQYCICPELIQAICWRESRFQPDAKNKAGTCIGIMQVYEKWHKDRMEKFGVTDLTDMRQNMTVAVDILADLLEDSEDVAAALMRYHGEKDVDEKVLAGKISDYARDILEMSEHLEREHGK